MHSHRMPEEPLQLLIGPELGICHLCIAADIAEASFGRHTSLLVAGPEGNVPIRPGLSKGSVSLYFMCKNTRPLLHELGYVSL
jgi:hypothetical protein